MEPSVQKVLLQRRMSLLQLFNPPKPPHPQGVTLVHKLFINDQRGPYLTPEQRAIRLAARLKREAATKRAMRAKRRMAK